MVLKVTVHFSKHMYLKNQQWLMVCLILSDEDKGK